MALPRRGKYCAYAAYELVLGHQHRKWDSGSFDPGLESNGRSNRSVLQYHVNLDGPGIGRDDQIARGFDCVNKQSTHLIIDEVTIPPTESFRYGLIKTDA